MTEANEITMRVAWTVLFLVILASGWTAAWFYAAYAAGRGFDDWQRTEAAQGRIWTCPNRSIGGFPVAIAIDCSDATFSGQAMGQGVEGTVAHVTAGVSLAHPRSVAVNLTSPFAYKTSDGQTIVSATWSHLDLALASLPNPSAAALHGSDVMLQGVFGASGQQSGKAARLDTTFALAGDATDPVVDFSIAIAGTDVPPLDDLLGGTDTVAVDLAGRVHHAIASDARTPEEMLEHWRKAGGTLDLASSQATRAASKVMASGVLKLDDAHRPQGRLDAQFFGLEPVLQRFGISGNLVGAGNLLSTLFGGSRKAPPTQPGALALPISFQQGRLAIGPIRTQVVVPPLY